MNAKKIRHVFINLRDLILTYKFVITFSTYTWSNRNVDDCNNVLCVQRYRKFTVMLSQWHRISWTIVDVQLFCFFYQFIHLSSLFIHFSFIFHSFFILVHQIFIFCDHSLILCNIFCISMLFLRWHYAE